MKAISFKKSFSGSLNIDFLRLAKNNFKSEKFEVSTKEPKVVFELLSGDSYKSKQDHSLCFTNFISDRTDYVTLARLEELFKDLSSIQSHQLNSVNMKERIENILSLYHFQNSEDLVESKVMKADLKGSLSNQDGVRAYFTFDHEVVEGEWIAKTQVIMIDLFHLVIPSKHKGKTADRSMRDTYHTNMNNKTCMSAFLNSHI
jgi:hypothetical protein